MASQQAAVAKPFIEHVHELRQRMFVVALAIVAGSGLGYALSDTLITLLREPLNQTLFYTNPTGAFSFVFRLSFTFGIIVAMPVILYQLMRFLGPVIRNVTYRYIITMMTASLLLAGVGIVGAYYIGLPSALQFLTGFHSTEIQSLITADEYFNFVLTYLSGSALLFQLPLIMLVINRIKPLKPRKLLSFERYVIAGSFIIGALLTPTPDPFNQALMSVPIIITYQIGVGLVWVANRRRKPAAVAYPVMPEIPEEILGAELPPSVRRRSAPSAVQAQAGRDMRPARPVMRRIERRPIQIDVMASSTESRTDTPIQDFDPA